MERKYAKLILLHYLEFFSLLLRDQVYSSKLLLCTLCFTVTFRKKHDIAACRELPLQLQQPLLALVHNNVPDLRAYHAALLHVLAAASTPRKGHVCLRATVTEGRTYQPPKSTAFQYAISERGAPAVILVNPYLDENVGACARAMLNFGLWDLRLVDPLCDHLNKAARMRAAGADELLEHARVFPHVAQALQDLNVVLATTARQRDMTVQILSPEEAARRAVEAMQRHVVDGSRVGIMFGSERNGLTNEDLSWATALLQIPTNPAFSSLNLGQAVQIVGYEIWKARAQQGVELGRSYHDRSLGVAKGTRMATVREIEGLWTRLKEVLDRTGFNSDDKQRGLLYDRIRGWLIRSEPDVRDINALHGALTNVVLKHNQLEEMKELIVESHVGHGKKRRRKAERDLRGEGKEEFLKSGTS